MNPRISRRETIEELRKEMETERDSLVLITKEFMTEVRRRLSDGTLTSVRYGILIIMAATAIFSLIVALSDSNNSAPVIINVPYGQNQPDPYRYPWVEPRPYPDHPYGAYLIPLVIPPRHYSH